MINEEHEDLCRSIYSIAQALNRLGNADAATPMGGLEALGAVILEGSKRVAEALFDVDRKSVV